MRIIAPSAEIISLLNGPQILKTLEAHGRLSWKSEGKTTDESAPAFIRMLMNAGHESVIEHVSASVRFIVDRGVSHELVRHRLTSVTQESTRYVSSATIVDEVKDEQDVINAYLSGLSMRRVSELSKGALSEWEIYKILDSRDIERRPHGNSGVVRHDFFDKIDTVEKSYLLGVIQADGNIRSGVNPQISITQHQDYAWYLQRMISEFIRPGVNLNNDRDCKQIRFVSEQCRNALVSIGIVPNKTYDQTDDDIEKLWSSVPSDLLPSFLRGFLDGDGSIRFYKQSNPGQTDSCRISWCGHKALLDKISGWFFDNFGYVSIVRKDPKCLQMHRLHMSNPEVGDKFVRLMLNGFRWPYGHPAKTSRMIERVGGSYPIAEFGDSKFVVIYPSWIGDCPRRMFMWMSAMDASERSYTKLRLLGATPQEARSVLPNSVKTELVITANLREWRTILKLRAAKPAHPQMREVCVPLLAEFKRQVPVIFDDILP